MFKFTYDVTNEFSEEEQKKQSELFPDAVYKHEVVMEDYIDPWPKVLEQFVAFVSKCYGYDISEDVAINKKRRSVEEWTGPVFDPDKDL